MFVPQTLRIFAEAEKLQQHCIRTSVSIFILSPQRGIRLT
jgi:hypothetical protein